MKKFLLVICLFMTVAAVYSQSIFENRGKDVSIDVREPVYNIIKKIPVIWTKLVVL